MEHADNSEDGEARRDLERMLVDLLTENGGKMAAKQVKAEVSDAGYSWTAANRAKEKADIESAKEKGTTKGGWTWFLPSTLP